MNTTVFYFTATGNSLYVAKQLDSQPVSIAQAIHDEDMTYKSDTIGIVCPVYGHEVPLLVKEFIEKATFETQYFYMILTYGNRHGGAAELIAKMLGELGVKVSYINVLLMVDNFLPSFDMNKQKKIDKKVDEHIDIIKNDISNCREFIAPVTDTDREANKEYLSRMAKMPENAFSHLYRITDECIGCEICTKVCPRKCFSMDNHRSVWNPDGCITCMACIHACPMMAIQMNMPEKNPKARYRNENISICEIVDSNNQLN